MKSVAYIPNSQPESAELGLRRTSWARTSNLAFRSCSGLPETIRWEKNVCAFLRCPVGVLLWDQVQFSSVQFLSHVQLPATLWTTARLPSITCLITGRDRPPCPSPTPGVYPNSCPLSQWCHPTISSSIIPFSSCPQSFPASGSFQMSQLFAWGGQSIGVSALTSVLPMNTQDFCLIL